MNYCELVMFTYLRYLGVSEVSGELFEDPDGSLNGELAGVLQGGHQKVEELRPLVGEVPLRDGRDGVGHGRTNLPKQKSISLARWARVA